MPNNLSWEDILDRVQDQRRTLENYAKDLKAGKQVKNPEELKRLIKGVEKNYDEGIRLLNELQEAKQKNDQNREELLEDVLEFEKKFDTHTFTTHPLMCAILGIEPKPKNTSGICDECGSKLEENGDCKFCEVWG